MTRRNANAAAGETTRIRLPLFWSAAAHFLAISALLLLGTRSGAVSFRGIVDVFLVGGTDGERGAEKRAVRDESAGELRTPGVPSGTPAVPPSAPFPSPRAQGTTAGEEGPGPTASFPAPDGRPSSAPPGTTVSATEVSGAAATPLRSSERGPSGGGNLSDPGSGGPGTTLLRERIESRIVYPEEAVRRGQQGEVILRIRIGAGGVPREIRVARSSGALLLDEAARRGVVRAAPLPSDPGWVEVPVRFRLR